LPKARGAVIKKSSWPQNEIFQKIQLKGQIEEREMYRTFNMGIGFTVICAPKKTSLVLKNLKEMDQQAWVIGEVFTGEHHVQIIT
ncbi:MAG: AIR synthase-related protein, partial [Acidobacteriota bacterium]